MTAEPRSCKTSAMNGPET